MSATVLLPGPSAPPARVGVGRLPARRVAERAGYVLFALFIFFTCFTFLRPSPYDFAAIPTLLVWGFLGIRLHRGALVFVLLLLAYHLGLLVALLPYLSEPDPTLWTAQSIYLMVTCVFFVMFFSDETAFRVRLATTAYIASCLFAAVCGIISYFQPASVLFTMDGRAAGVFEDPNVLGSFLTFGAFALLRRLLARETRFPVVSAVGLGLILVALFLTFSRGAWGAFVLGTLVTAALTYRTSGPDIRRRVLALVVAGIALSACGIAAILSDRETSLQFADRFTLTKDYDEGVTGRFGNQIRSIPLLAERPEGFGPLRFRLRFGLEPHNSFIGGFANGGWISGFAFLGMVLVTIAAGLRLCLQPSPMRPLAQAVMPAVLMIFLQAFQIDIDHWRHVYILLGMVWGLECARQRWAAGVRAAMVRAAARRSGEAGPSSRAILL